MVEQSRSGLVIVIAFPQQEGRGGGGARGSGEGGGLVLEGQYKPERLRPPRCY
jgi:hypothetical protein